MQPDQILNLLSRVTHKPGSSISLQYDNVNYYLLFEVVVPDLLTGRPRKLSDTMILHSGVYLEERDLAKIIERGFKSIEYHEVDEWLKIDGKHLNEPHPETYGKTRMRYT